MTDAERYQLVSYFTENSFSAFNGFSTHLGIYLTLLFAYCVVAYTAGASLSRFQVVLVSLMFFLAAEFQAFTMANLGQRAIEFGELARGFMPPDAPLGDDSGFRGRSGFSTPVGYIGRSLWQLGIFSALLFMWNVRRTK